MIKVNQLLKTVSTADGDLDILRGIDLEIEQGASAAIVGASGSGKSTLLGLLAGMDLPSAGEIWLDGEALGDLDEDQRARLRAEKVGFVFQSFQLLPALTARENVMLGASGHVRSGIVADALAMPWTDAEQRHVREKAEAAMAELGVLSEADRLPGEMPYPVQKRVALARALVSDPKVLLLDEPAGGIGAADMHELGRLIRSWVPERTVLLVEHHMELVMEVCDLIWVLDAGKVIAAGSPEEVRNDPAVLAAYLGEDDHEDDHEAVI